MGAIADGYDHLRAVGVSADRSVTITLTGRGGIEVMVEPGTVGRLSPARLADEVRGALVAAVGDYSRASDRLFERWAGPAVV